VKNKCLAAVFAAAHAVLVAAVIVAVARITVVPAIAQNA